MREGECSWDVGLRWRLGLGSRHLLCQEGRQVCGSSSRHVEWLCLRELFSLGKMGDLRSLASGISLRGLSHVQPCCRVGK